MLSKTRLSRKALPTNITRLLVGALLCTTLLVSGCESGIEPFDEEGAYSIYGILSTSGVPQLIRVKPLSVPITKVDSSTLDATTVTLENRSDGTTEVLDDSVFTFVDQNTEIITHNFVVDRPLTPGTEYRIVIEGPDGKATEATTTTPENPSANLSPENGDCLEQFLVVLQDVRDPRRLHDPAVEFRYSSQWVSLPATNKFETDDGQVAFGFRPESLLGERIPEQTLPNDRDPNCWRATRCSELENTEVRIRYTLLGPNWFGGVPQDSLTYNPLESPTVTDGLGFLGAAHRGLLGVSVDTAQATWTGGRFCDEDPPSN